MTCTLTLGSTTLDLTTGGYYVTSVDPGFPVVRQVSSSRPDVNGTDDTTTLFGERVVSLDIICNGTRQTLLDNLAPFLVPSARPVLTVDSRQITVRPAQRSVALVAPSHVARVQLQFVAPSGVWEAASATTVTINKTFGGGVGRSFPGVHNRTYTATAPASSALCTNAGTVSTYPTVKVYGPIVNPRVVNQAAGTQVKLNTSLQSGEYAEIDYLERTIRKNGSAALNLLPDLDVSSTTWTPLAAGSNRIILGCDSYSDGAYATVVFRSAYL